MNILIIGKGGREHALASKFAEDTNVENVFVYPGNPGMQRTKKIITLNEYSDDEFFVKVKNLLIQIVIIGPEEFIVNGFADRLKSLGLNVLSPSKFAAQLESSKIFSKNIMIKYGIPTAKYLVAYNLLEAMECLRSFDNGVVLKLSGLHSGKGVYVANTFFDAKEKLIEWKDFLIEGIVFEEILVGHEVSMFYLCKRNTAIFLGEACDYKRVFDNNLGNNTGGMGCFSPDFRLSDVERSEIYNKFVLTTLSGMELEGIPFEGVLFLGLMITKDGPKLLEYNVRLGDPETQTILPLIRIGFLDLFIKYFSSDISLFKNHKLEFSNQVGLHVVKVAKGYPANSSKGDILELENEIDQKYYFSSVIKHKDKLITNGGRICGLTVLGINLNECRNVCYEKLGQVSFQGEHYRKDIGLV